MYSATGIVVAGYTIIKPKREFRSPSCEKTAYRGMTNTIDGIRYISITEPENHSLPVNFNLAKAYAPGIENNKVIKTVTIDTRNEFIKKI